MRQNLTYSVCPLDSDAEDMERQLIRECEPLLNLKGWRNPQRRMIGRMRAVCREEAKRVRSACQ